MTGREKDYSKSCLLFATIYVINLKAFNCFSLTKNYSHSMVKIKSSLKILPVNKLLKVLFADKEFYYLELKKNIRKKWSIYIFLTCRVSVGHLGKQFNYYFMQNFYLNQAFLIKCESILPISTLRSK